MTGPVVFDRAQVRRNRARAASGLHAHTFLFDWTMRELTDRLGFVRRQFPRLLQLGGRAAPDLTNRLAQAAGADFTVVADSAIPAQRGGAVYVAADEEALPFAPHSFDLIISPLTLHSVNDLPGALIQIRRALKPDGLFLGALPGGETLHELRQCLMETELSHKGGISPRVAPFADKQQMGALMQRAGFALPVIDSEILTVTYANLPALLHDLRGMGEANAVAARRAGFGRALWQDAARLYQSRHADADGRIAATFETIFVIGWAPHESQQQPLRRGSATHSLTALLGDL